MKWMQGNTSNQQPIQDKSFCFDIDVQKPNYYTSLIYVRKHELQALDAIALGATALKQTP